jgi:hypothetical protein
MKRQEKRHALAHQQGFEKAVTEVQAAIGKRQRLSGFAIYPDQWT